MKNQSKPATKTRKRLTVKLKIERRKAVRPRLPTGCK
jgi:hypothetical protein